MTPSGIPDASATSRGILGVLAQTFAGIKTFAALLVASAGIQVAAIFNTNGTNASDVGVVTGVSTSDGSLHSGAKVASWGAGVGGTYVEYMFRKKAEFTFWGDFVTVVKWDAGGANHWEMRARPNFNWELGNNSVTYMGCRISDGYCFSQYGFDVNPTGAQSLVKAWGSGSGSGRVDQRGVDRRGVATGSDAPGNYPMGINRFASGATTCTITTSLAGTASHVEITWLGDPGARSWVTLAAGSFTVNLSAAPGANIDFSWRISNLL